MYIIFLIGHHYSMIYHIQAPQRLQTSICLPASKSISNRALLMSRMGEQCVVLSNLSDCDDTMVMQRALCHDHTITDIMAAGTAMRFLTAYYASSPGKKTLLTGTERMKHRPIAVLVNALRSLGAEIDYAGEEGFPPLEIVGKRLSGGDICLPGDISSQYISALMMIAPLTEQGLTIHITGQLISQSYVRLTECMMKEFGAEVQRMDERTIHIPHGSYSREEYLIENDWSASSYWYEIIALASDESSSVVLPYLSEDSLQGDSEVKHLFAPLGVKTEMVPQGIRLSQTGDCCSLYEADLQDQPDLAQTLVVTCAMKGIPFRITGLQTLRIKETDRLTALMQELKKLGYVIKEDNGCTLYWEGEKKDRESCPVIETYEDHRMAMAFAPCAMKEGTIAINHPEVVRKSYPRFWEDLKKAGFIIH